MISLQTTPLFKTYRRIFADDASTPGGEAYGKLHPSDPTAQAMDAHKSGREGALGRQAAVAVLPGFDAIEPGIRPVDRDGPDLTTGSTADGKRPSERADNVVANWAY